jgi:thioredoxin 1
MIMDQQPEPEQVEPENALREPGKKKAKSFFLILRILIPILVVFAAVGLYFLKNLPDAKDDDTSEPAVSGYYQTAAFDLDATENFDLEKILSYNLPVIIDFGSDSCIPCQEMAPVLAELNQELRGKAVVKFVDVWINSAAGQEVPLEIIPTQFFFNADGSPYVPADKEAAAANGFILYNLKETGKHVYTAHQGGLDKESILTVLNELGMK